MLNHQQKLDETHLCSSGPTLKMHARRNSISEQEFAFWGSCKSPYEESFDGGGPDHFNSGSTEPEFQATANTEEEEEEGFRVYSPQLWKTNRSSSKQESLPLLPHNHHYSNLSPNSRRQAIVDGRKELMEMIQHLPESCYELSLKDIVAEDHSLQEGEEDSTTVTKDETFDDFKAEAPIMKLNRKKRSIRKGQITRTGSLESETFLIKSFLPSSLGSKKKAKSARVPSIKSSDEAESDVDKVCWIKGTFIAGRRNKICRSSTSGSNSSSQSSSSSTGITRYASETDFIPGCWPFFSTRKSKSMREKGCIY
ncbi:uncharacterized protein LOC133801965 [Humulus lupulus]|uniref:uncharacterized protein LOC133801965 n=1 Tax=Humulus lupulus TaxID=3486 RepID=UPI002B415F82|nr:uncharacterized protein LOC133801965 [Humulus lupulus]